MPRSLRPRTTKVDYSALLEQDDGSLPAEDDEGEFILGADAGAEEEQLSELSSADASGEEDDGVDVESKMQIDGLTHAKAKAKKPATPKKGASKKKPGRKPAEYLRKKGEYDHRARTGPVFFYPFQVERLLEEPEPFKPGRICSANAWNSDGIIADKVSKASALNLGSGPVWELLEDRSWWRESFPLSENEIAFEARRRPRVREGVGVRPDIQIISHENAMLYLPEGLSGSSPGKIKCNFGQPGNERSFEFEMLQSMGLSEHFPTSNANVLWAGAPVFALDWCPIFTEDQPCRLFKQYIALAPFPSKSHTPSVGVKCPSPAPSCIQLWSYSAQDEDDESKDTNSGRLSCEMILCIENGSCMDLKWCPLPSNDPWTETSSTSIRKLGLLGGIFEDGSLSIFVVPDPTYLSSSQTASPIYVKVQPSLRISLEEASICSFDWANSTLIAAGCSNGVIAVYDLTSAFPNETRPYFETKIFPSHYVSAHQSAIRSIVWATLPSYSGDGELDLANGPYIIASGGFDGCEMLTDIREGVPTLLNRTRDVVLAMSYSRFNEGIVTVDQDMVVKNYAFDTQQFGIGRVMMEAKGAIWSLSTSDYHPMLAVASADGGLYTTNMLKTIRRGERQARLLRKVYEMDFSRKSGEYRMFDQFLPEEIVDRRNASKRSGVEASNGVGVWPQEVSVTCARWNNGSGLARAPLLASATSSGLCRIDWLTGQFVNKVVPFGGVDGIRQSVVISDDDDED